MEKNTNGKYSVTTIFRDNGDVEARETRPSDRSGEYKNFDLYIDEFEDEDQAVNFINEAAWC